MHYVKRKRNSKFTPRKRGLSRHHVMHHFHAITSIILLLHESRPENRENHAITLTAGGVSIKKSLEDFLFFNMANLLQIKL